MITFKRAIAIVAIVAIFGGGSLGLGLSVGFAIGRQHIESRQPQIQQPILETSTEEQAAFTFADQYTESISVDIRTSDITGVVQNVSGSVVSINIDIPSRNLFFGGGYNPGSGSGIVFAKDENFLYVATNNHVVYNAARIGVSFDDEYEVEATFIDGNWYADLAIISIPLSKVEGKDFHVAVFGDSDQMRVGDEVVAIGNPMGGGQTATRGIVSAVNRQITVDGRTLDVLQTDAAINPGNSGGALANIRGEIIGINTAKAISFQIEGMGYAIPSNLARVILEQLLEEGTTPQPFLGISWVPIGEDMRRMYALPSVGVIVMNVQPDSPALEGGLEELDLIVGFNGQLVASGEDFLRALNDVNVGDTVTMQIYRNGILPMELRVVVGDANARE